MKWSVQRSWTDVMADESLVRQAVKIVGVCACWYALSAANNVLGKEILSVFPHPVTLPMMQLTVSVCLLGPLLTLDVLPQVPPAPNLSGWFFMKSLVPLGLGKLLAKMAGYVSLGKLPVSYNHTVKALMPFFTVFLSLVLLKETYTLKVYLSLIPIVVGVLMASVTEVQFNATGLAWAMVSTFFSALINVWAKKCMTDVRIHHMRLLLHISQVGIVVLFPLWMYIDVWDVTTQPERVPNLVWLVFALPVSGLLDFGQSLAAFWMISLLSPLSYSVANSTKRIAIIVASLLILRNPVSLANLFWMSMAVIGVVLYNKVKYDSSKQAGLPLPGHTHHTDHTHRTEHTLDAVTENCSPSVSEHCCHRIDLEACNHSVSDGCCCCHRIDLDNLKLPLKII